MFPNLDTSSLQIRPQGGGPPYAPARDLVNSFAQIARRACYLLAPDEHESDFKHFVESQNVSLEDLSESAKVVAQFINATMQSNTKDPLDALTKAGFDKLSSQAKMALLVRIGQVTMSMFYACVRDSHKPNELPAGADQLMNEAEEIRKLILK